MKRLLSLIVVDLMLVVVLKARLQSINRVLGNAMVASKTTSLGIATFSWLYNGVAYSKDSNASFSLTASAQATSTYNIYLFSIGIAGMASVTKGTASI